MSKIPILLIPFFLYLITGYLYYLLKKKHSKIISGDIPLIVTFLLSILLCRTLIHIELINIIPISLVLLFVLFYSRLDSVRKIKSIYILIFDTIAIIPLFIAGIKIYYISGLSNETIYTTWTGPMVTFFLLILMMEVPVLLSKLPGIISGGLTLNLIGILFTIRFITRFHSDYFNYLILAIGLSTAVLYFDLPPVRLKATGSSIRMLGLLTGILSIQTATKSNLIFAFIIPLLFFVIIFMTFFITFLFTYVRKNVEISSSSVYSINLTVKDILLWFFTEYLIVLVNFLYFKANGIDNRITYIVLIVETLLFSFGFYIYSVKSGKKKFEKQGTVDMKNEFFGLNMCRLNFDEVIDLVMEWLRKNQKKFIITINPLMLIKCLQSKGYANAVHKADLIISDGAGIVWGANLLGINIKQKIPGIDLVKKLFENSQYFGYKFILVGSNPGTVHIAKEYILEEYPGINIAGIYHGYHIKRQYKKIIAEMVKNDPDIILVGMGLPKQEKWIIENAGHFKKGIFIGVGGTFDILSKKVKRAPKIFQKIGFEWLYRLIQEPSRLKRMLNLPYYSYLVLMEKIKD